MKKTSFFSVVIPCYNRATSILKTLNSVKNQTFPDFECIIVDDGSQDGQQLEKSIASLNDDRFIYLRHENGGACKARNTGIKNSIGKFIAFLDSDDIFLEDKLETDRELLAEIDNHKTVIFSQILVDRGLGNLTIIPSRGPLQDEPIADYLIRGGGFTQTSTLVVESELAKQTLFKVGLPMAQDYDFPIRLEMNGAKFIMKEQAKVIWMDVDDPNRVSNMPQYEPMLDWIEEMRTYIGEKSYYAFKGTHIARLSAPSKRAYAFSLFMQAVLNRALPLRLMIKALIQIALPRSIYRKFYDWFLNFKKMA